MEQYKVGQRVKVVGPEKELAENGVAGTQGREGVITDIEAPDSAGLSHRVRLEDYRRFKVSFWYDPKHLEPINPPDMDTQPVETVENGIDTIITRPESTDELKAALRAIKKEAEEMLGYIEVEQVFKADCEVRDSIATVLTIASRVLGGLNIDMWTEVK